MWGVGLVLELFNGTSRLFLPGFGGREGFRHIHGCICSLGWATSVRGCRVLTVNVPFCFCGYVLNWWWWLWWLLSSCFLWRRETHASGWPCLKHSWCKHLLTVFFFYQMSIVVSNECIYFWCPDPPPPNPLGDEQSWYLRLEGGGTLGWYLFCFKDFKLRIKNDPKQPLTTNLWRGLFWGELVLCNFKRHTNSMMYTCYCVCLSYCYYRL